ncbi:hypothetical protein AGMMS49983_07440 [Clostridia bacterium]|nr:hypothetical protein AGMMS49983_07440 [Clostridia bacterium]
MYTHSKKTSNVVFHRLLVALLILTMTLGYSLTGFASVWADDTPVEVTDPAEAPDPEPTPDPATVEETAEDPAPEPEQELAPASAEASAEETTDAPITENALVAPMAVPEETVVAPEAINPPEVVNPDSHKLNIDYVRFVNETVGDPVHADRVYLDLVSGDAFNIASPAIAGFTIVGALVDNVRNDSILSGTKNVVGTMPNAERNVKVLYAPNPASYKVEYYFQKQGTEAFAGGEPVYEWDTTVDKSGKVDTAITAADVLLSTVPVGYELSARQAGNAVFGTVALNNATVVKVYYDLKAVYVTFDALGGSFVSPIAAHFGDTVSLTGKTSAASKDHQDQTFEKTFYGWTLNSGTATSATPAAPITELTLNEAVLSKGTTVTLYANWVGDDKVVYRVAYWLENVDSTNQDLPANYSLANLSLANLIDKSVITGSIYDIIPDTGVDGQNLKPSYEGFALYKKGDVPVKNGDGTYTQNVYYSRNTYTLKAYGWNWSNNSYVELKSQSFKYGASLAAFWADPVVSGKTYSLTKATGADPSNQWASGTLAGYPNVNGSGQYTVPVTMPDPGKIADDEGTVTTLKVWDFLSSKNGQQNSARYRDQLYVYLEKVSSNDATEITNYEQVESRPVTHMSGQHTTAATAYLAEQRPGFTLNTSLSDDAFAVKNTTPHVSDNVTEYGYNSSTGGATPANTLTVYYTRNTTTVNFYASAADFQAGKVTYSLKGLYESDIDWTEVKALQNNDANEMFDGWFTNPGNIGNVVDPTTLATFPAQTTTSVFAHWKAAELVDVRFIDDENTVDTTKQVYAGQNINTAGIGQDWTWLAPTSANKGFRGWFEKDATAPFSLDGTITEPTTLYAQWSEKLDYVVRYLKHDIAAGTYSEYAPSKLYPDAGPAGFAITATPVIDPADKVWFPTTLSQSLTLQTNMTNNVITFIYTEQPEVAYATEFILVDENGDQIESLGRIDRKTRNDQVFIRALTLIGYDLHADQDISTAAWQSLLVDGRLTDGKVFTYKYVVKTDERPQPLSIIYDANGGTGAVPEDPTSYFPENTADVLTTPVPTRTAYTFGGWGLTPNGSQAVQQVTFADRDITLYAIWTPVVTITTTDPEDPIIVDPQVVVTPPVVTPLVAPPAPAPAAPVAAPATVTTVEQDATPAATTTLPDGATPLSVKTAWALFNLILTIVTVLIMVALLLTYFARRREDEEFEHDLDHEERVKKHLGVRLISIAAAAIAIILFVRTEDMNAPMQLMDNWTVWHIVITAAAVILAIFAKKSYKAEDIREVEA